MTQHLISNKINYFFLYVRLANLMPLIVFFSTATLKLELSQHWKVINSQKKTFPLFPSLISFKPSRCSLKPWIAIFHWNAKSHGFDDSLQKVRLFCLTFAESIMLKVEIYCFAMCLKLCHFTILSIWCLDFEWLDNNSSWSRFLKMNLISPLLQNSVHGNQVMLPTCSEYSMQRFKLY